MRHHQTLSSHGEADAPAPMIGIVNGVLGSIALWALIAGVVIVAS